MSHGSRVFLSGRRVDLTNVLAVEKKEDRATHILTRVVSDSNLDLAIRKHPNVLPMVMVNIFLGWTIIGWIAAFIWAIMAIDTTRHYR